MRRAEAGPVRFVRRGVQAAGRSAPLPASLTAHPQAAAVTRWVPLPPHAHRLALAVPALATGKPSCKKSRCPAEPQTWEELGLEVPLSLRPVLRIGWGRGQAGLERPRVRYRHSTNQSGGAAMLTTGGKGKGSFAGVEERCAGRRPLRGTDKG